MDKRDLEFIEDIASITKHLLWQSEVGDQHAQEIIDEIHQGKYGSRAGLWPQFRRTMERLSKKSTKSVSAQIHDMVARLCRDHGDFMGAEDLVVLLGPEEWLEAEEDAIHALVRQIRFPNEPINKEKLELYTYLGGPVILLPSNSPGIHFQVPRLVAHAIAWSNR